MCGENIISRVQKSSVEGSPPRVRGKLPKTCQTMISQKDHPRVCGENRASLETRVLTMGSPPRVRGKPRTMKSSARTQGITPACAGKTFFITAI